MAQETVRKLDANTRVEAVPGQVSAEVQGEVVILQVETGRYYSLDEVASRTWQMLQEPQSSREIVDQLIEEYDVERRRCEQDVDELLGGFLERGLVRIVRDARR